MTDTPTIAVRGEATLDVDAEVAEFTASVEVHEAERVAALARVAERVAAVRGGARPVPGSDRAARDVPSVGER